MFLLLGDLDLNLLPTNGAVLAPVNTWTSDLPGGDREEGLKLLLLGDLDLDLDLLRSSLNTTCLGGEGLDTFLGGDDLEPRRGGE